jgi:hypothetical protein
VREPYHTALLSGHVEDVEPRDHWAEGGDEAFVHDLLSGPLPKPYRRCDLLYAEVPWPHGFDRFEERAGVEEAQRTWVDLMSAFIEGALNLNAPLVFVTNRAHHLELPQPNRKVPGRLNGAHAMLWCYDIEVPGGNVNGSDLQLLDWLARRHECIGDPMCGYGRAGRVFSRRGKHFVMSDYNPNCIGYIAERAASWRK